MNRVPKVIRFMGVHYLTFGHFCNLSGRATRTCDSCDLDKINTTVIGCTRKTGPLVEIMEERNDE